ncbi:MAG TPA: diacylglycerol kinase family protein [Anaerolineales bacterium]|nr:diacylglycerol kinase family protein [Anaerolineales bacterium]
MQIDIQQKPKTFIVVNPVAGVSQSETVREKIGSALQPKEIPFEIYETTGKDNFKQIIRNAVQEGFKVVIVAGGDGTLSGVVDGLVDTQIPLLILPTGTWNALAQALNIPLEFDAAMDLLFQEHRIQTIDAMQIDKNYYVLSVSAGVGARTLKDVKREEKRRFGRLAELRSAIVNVLEFRSHTFDVKIDGTFTKFRASELLVSNSSILGIKALQLDPDIRMDDGKLNVCRIYANSIAEYLRLAASMLRGDQKHNWNIVCMEALQEVEIHCKERLPVQGDGDLIGKLPITVKIHPKAVQIVTPASSEV